MRYIVGELKGKEMRITPKPLEKVYVHEYFPGIEQVFPDKEIVQLDTSQDIHDFGVLKCMQCGAEGLFSSPPYIINARFLVENDNITIHFEECIPIGRLKIQGDDDSGTPGFMDIFEDDLVHGFQIPCSNCGGAMAWTEYIECYEPCPGCHICGWDQTREEAVKFCVDKYFRNKCVPDCNECKGHYARQKHNIAVKDVKRLVNMLRKA